MMHRDSVFGAQLFEHGDHVEYRDLGTHTAFALFEKTDEQLLTIRHGATFPDDSARCDYGPEGVVLLGPRVTILKIESRHDSNK